MTLTPLSDTQIAVALKHSPSCKQYVGEVPFRTWVEFVRQVEKQHDLQLEAIDDFVRIQPR